MADNSNQRPTACPPGFSMVPAWLLWAQPSANAVLVYIHLAAFGTFNTAWQVYDECRPSVATLAHGGHRKDKDGYPGTGLSESSVKRALAELKELGAIEGVKQFHESGGKAPTVYRLIHNRPVTSD